VIEDFTEIGHKLSNWGRWGDDDERGTLNFITPETVVTAARSIRSGKVFELSLPLGSTGPQVTGRAGRFNPIHTMTMVPGDVILRENPDDIVIADDAVFLPLQAATQWDSLAHFGYQGLLYNNRPARGSVEALTGASVNSIDKILPGMVGRGVLLDIARLRGVDWMAADDDPIEPEELERAEQDQGVRVGTADVLLVRTGWRKKAAAEGWSEEWLAECPGLSLRCAEWIHERELASVASDNWCVEIYPPRSPGDMPLHCVLLRDMGVLLGEMFDLEELSADCVGDEQWDFFFSGPPLRVVGGVGSTASPIAVK
jgi:kynurenine formamidase